MKLERRNEMVKETDKKQKMNREKEKDANMRENSKEGQRNGQVSGRWRGWQEISRREIRVRSEKMRQNFLI